ncbi:MAG: acetyl-CoA synthetase, partial [Clostridiales bacterium]|nr:acetyl-CoA synthetase [Clostridiales bacterium]
MLGKFIERDYVSYEDFYQNFDVKFNDDFNFAFDVVDGYAETKPNKLALLWCDDHGQEKRFTFGDMSRLSNQAANMFKSLGIKKGDTVLMMMRRRYEYWYLILALHKIGAIAIPATHLLTEKDIVYRINAAQVKCVVTIDDNNMVPEVDASAPQCPSLQHKIVLESKYDGWLTLHEAMEGMSESFPRPTGDDATLASDPMLMYFTSGTTGLPKMVLHNFTYPLGHIITAKYWHNLDENSLHITVADTGWAKCSWGKIYGQWIVGAAQFVYDMDKFVPAKLLEKLAHYKVTSFCAPPTIYRFMIQEDITKYDLSSIRNMATAGEPLNPEVFNQIKSALGIEIVEGYGQSETTPIMATFKWLPVHTGSMGKPSPGYDVELINDAGEVCDVGEEGQIVVFTRQTRPIGLFSGYYKDAEKTRAAWHYGAYHTGDVAWKDEMGYYWFVGRADDVIKSSGYRIGPFEVESALMEHPAVVECAISGVPDPVRGQVVKASIVLAEGYAASDELKKELQDHVKRVTAPYKYPRVIEFMDELPKTISGKIKRAQIRKQDS